MRLEECEQARYSDADRHHKPLYRHAQSSEFLVTIKRRFTHGKPYHVVGRTKKSGPKPAHIG